MPIPAPRRYAGLVRGWAAAGGVVATVDYAKPNFLPPDTAKAAMGLPSACLNVDETNHLRAARTRLLG